MSAFAPGDVVADRFQIVKRVGAGGLAEVLLAHDQVSDGDVALKVLHAHLSGDAALAQRFRREMAITRALDHAGIVRVFDLHEHEGRPFFSMELLAGRTLSERLLEGPLLPAEARRIAREICAALQSAHRAGVIHRDLKPQNVFLLAPDEQVKILDFGLARVEGQARLTAQSAVMGTPGYIAPELYAGERPDARADVYSIGATLLEMLGGRGGLANSDPYASPAQAIDLDRIQAANPLVAGADEAVLRRALHPDPEQRFCDAGQMLKALAGEAVPPAPDTPPPMTAGEYEVDVRYAVDLFRRRGSVLRVVRRLGGTVSERWRFRLACAGRGVLISGASRRTAEAAVAICAEEGLPAIVQARRERRLDWLTVHGAWIFALAAGLAGALFAAIFERDPRLGGIFGALAGYLLSWGLPPLSRDAPISGLPRHDSGMRRLAEGIHRRAGRLRERAPSLPGPQQAVLAGLLQAADDATGLAQEFAEAHASPVPGAQPLPSGAVRALETLTSRLLEIATALDDALVLAEDPAALSRLREGVAAASAAIPRLLTETA